MWKVYKIIQTIMCSTFDKLYYVFINKYIMIMIMMISQLCSIVCFETNIYKFSFNDQFFLLSLLILHLKKKKNLSIEHKKHLT